MFEENLLTMKDRVDTIEFFRFMKNLVVSVLPLQRCGPVNHESLIT